MDGSLPRKLISENTDKLSKEYLRRRRIYENGNRDKLPEDFWIFYEKWLTAWENMDKEYIISLRDNLCPKTIHQYAEWMYQVKKVLSQ